MIVIRAVRQKVPTGQALKVTLQYGVLVFGANFALLYWGERVVPSGLAAVFYATIPITTALLTRAFGIERLTATKVIAAVVAFGGVALIFSGQLSATVPAVPLLAVFVAASLSALAGVLLKRGPRQSALGVNAIGALVGLPICLAASFATGESHALPATAGGWIPIVYLALFGSMGGFVLYAWLVNHWPLTRISFIAVVVPVVAMLLGTVVKHEQLGPLALAGSALVVVGLLIEILGERVKRA